MMNTTRTILQRTIRPSLFPSTLRLAIPTNHVAAAMFSSECAPAQKVRNVLEEYRIHNFSDELPSRFRKQIIKEIKDPEQETFCVDSLNRILKNIGRDDARLTNDELDALLREAGIQNTQNERRMPIAKMLQLM